MRRNKLPLLIREDIRRQGITNSYLADTHGIPLKELYGLEIGNMESREKFIKMIINELHIPAKGFPQGSN